MYGRQSIFVRALAASLTALLILWGGAAWAGGNTAFRNPGNLSQVVNKVWDDRMLPIPWLLSQDGIPGSTIDNPTLIAELTAAFDTWEALATSKLDSPSGGRSTSARPAWVGRSGRGSTATT